MRNKYRRIASATLMLLMILIYGAQATPFPIVTTKTKVSIVYAPGQYKLDSIAAHLLAADIQKVTGYLPPVFTDVVKAKGNVIMIGAFDAPLIKAAIKEGGEQLQDKWECYRLKVVDKPFPNIEKALVIAGSDARGTAYGVFHISEKIGVSPWYWWADVAPEQKKEMVLNIDDYISIPPSVKYRGIFINDEDWGLQPWAAKTFEPETGDIGPKTYAKIFELLLRLKANFIWPAMHPSTKPFYSYPGNKQVAADYEMVIGSSHAEPMLRNNVGEWDEKTMGPFNYLTNKAKVQEYWETRIKESSANNVIYSMGMRGVHDSPIEGVKTSKEAVPLVEQIFADQRRLFQQYINPDVTIVPQVFTAYKEVLDIYANGLKVPDDVTLMWPDDNYGYIQRLSNAQEQKRSGGSGVYYHASYWGRPHDYLWLSTTHPALIREEMTKAYVMNAKKIWVLNIGDIKPAEYNMQLFLDMAYRIDSFQNAAYSVTHLQNWVANLFGKQGATAITKVLWDYYNLAFERKPEYMGWSQTEPTTPIQFTKYNHFYFGDQAQQRIDRYQQIETAANSIASAIPAYRKDAYYQLVRYPVMGASLMNKKFLYRDKAYFYARQGRISAKHYNALSKKAYDEIEKETRYYNTQLVNGKWNGIMSMKPRNLPVYQLPVDTLPGVSSSVYSWNVLPEGTRLPDSLASNRQAESLSLPDFDNRNKQQYFIDIFLTKEDTIDFTIETSAAWIKPGLRKVRLLPQALVSQERVWVSVDLAKAPKDQQLKGYIRIKGKGRQITVNVKANRISTPLPGNKDYVESDRYIVMNAVNYTHLNNQDSGYWKTIEGLGSAGKALQAFPLGVDTTTNLADTGFIRKQASVTYDFYTVNNAAANILIYTLPTYPLNTSFEMRYGVSVDNGPITILNFKTVGRSEEWKQGVLSNATMKKVSIPALKRGSHKLTIYKMDPSVILDRIFIDLGVNQPFYGALKPNPIIN